MPEQDQVFTVAEQTPKVHAGHPLRNQKAEKKLVDYCVLRLTDAHQAKKSLNSRLGTIDKELSGFLKKDLDDPEVKEQDDKHDEDPRTQKAKPQLALMQIGRGVTYLLSVFSPDSGMYEAIATRADQDIANAFVSLMNNQSERAGYFRQMAVFLLQGFKYNIGGLHLGWKEEFGNVIASQGGATEGKAERKRIWQGNELRAVDMYNTLWDPSVFPVDVHSKGEYCAEVRLESAFRIKRMAEGGEIFRVNRWINEADTSLYGDPPAAFYTPIPQVRMGETDGDRLPDGSMNWGSILSPLVAGQSSQVITTGHELVDIYIRLSPKEFGLVAKTNQGRDNLEIWRLTIARGKYLCAATYINSVHDKLPYVFGVPNEDNLGLQSKSVAESLLPLQNFGAFLLNTHMAATRKNIWDLIVYNPQFIDLRAVGNDVAARVPFEPTATGKIEDNLKQFSSTLDTKGTLADFQKVIELMEFFFPTQMLRQVADLQRATKDQAAATVQAGHRDLWKFAKLIDVQAFTPMRFMMHGNILQYQESVDIPNPNARGQEDRVIKIDPQKFRDAGIEYVIGEGLKGLDKLTVLSYMKELLFAVLQSREATMQIDVVALLDHWSSQMGMHTDLTQFRRSIEEIERMVGASNATATPPAAQ